MLVIALMMVASQFAPAIESCVELVAPVEGPVVSGFAPVGRYAGHWGVDLLAPPGVPVVAAGAGTVTFAGAVAGRLSVTVDHGGGLRTSYSYLSRVNVSRGSNVTVGVVLAVSGVAHGREAVHFSVRIGNRYVDPVPWLGCLRAPGSGLRLVSLVGL